MPIQSRETSWSAWTFLAGVILAIVIGVGTTAVLPLQQLKDYSAEIYGVLVLLGILVGYFTQITGKESQTFLIAGTIIVVVSRFGMESVAGSLIGIGLGDTVSSTFGALLALFVPATIIVALKTVFSVSNV
jgi:hypothetical protein